MRFVVIHSTVTKKTVLRLEFHVKHKFRTIFLGPFYTHTKLSGPFFCRGGVVNFIRIRSVLLIGGGGRALLNLCLKTACLLGRFRFWGDCSHLFQCICIDWFFRSCKILVFLLRVDWRTLISDDQKTLNVYSDHLPYIDLSWKSGCLRRPTCLQPLDVCQVLQFMHTKQQYILILGHRTILSISTVTYLRST